MKVVYTHLAPAFLLFFAFASPGVQDSLAQTRPRHRDPRLAYDVRSYDLHFRVRPDSERIDGSEVVRVRLLRAGVDSLVLDAGHKLLIEEVTLGDSADAAFRHSDGVLAIALPRGLETGHEVRLRIRYRYSGQGGPPTPVRFGETPTGEPWINTSCQLDGAHQWWPCKASFFHPEDKADTIRISLSFPDTLWGVANGRFLGEHAEENGWKTTRWLMVNPRATYLVSIYVGPYVHLEQPYVDTEGNRRTLHYYVLRSDSARARAEFFSRIPEMLRCYERWFGPFAFWEEKFALVQSLIPGMEHSTAVAVGPIFPHTMMPGEPNPLAWYEEYFNYMAVHETAHEWWGNAVTALDWGEFWLHEGFATYAEALWVEHLFGREVMHQYMATLSFRIDSTTTVYRPEHETAREAYHLNIYYKGAWVLHMLRYVMGDSAFFEALRRFNTHPAYRYHNATTADFQAVCEELYGDDLSWFFLPWIYRSGWPHIQVKTIPRGNELVVDILDTCYVRNSFRMPIDLRVETADGVETRRVWAVPGRKRIVLRFSSSVRSAEATGLRWILDGPKRGTLWYFTDLDFIKGRFLGGLQFTNDRQVYVPTDSSAWESPTRSLFPGAQWLKLYLDPSQDPRWSKARLLVREYHFRRSQRQPWQEVGPNGEIPQKLRTVRRIEYRIELGKLKGEVLPIPRVVLEYR